MTPGRTWTTFLVPPPSGGGNEAGLGRKQLLPPPRTWTATSLVPPPFGGGNETELGRKPLLPSPWTGTTASLVPPPTGGGTEASITPLSPTLPPTRTPRTPPTHTLPHIPPPLTPPLQPSPISLSTHTRRHTPRGRSCTPGFPGDRFSSLGGNGALHPRYTRLYTHAAHHSCSHYTPPTRLPSMSGRPQAEMGTSVYRHRRRRRHRYRHDGAVAYPTQPPAASPRCRTLP